MKKKIHFHTKMKKIKEKNVYFYQRTEGLQRFFGIFLGIPIGEIGHRSLIVSDVPAQIDADRFANAALNGADPEIQSRRNGAERQKPRNCRHNGN